MDVDDRGRVWIAEAIHRPNSIQKTLPKAEEAIES